MTDVDRAGRNNTLATSTTKDRVTKDRITKARSLFAWTAICLFLFLMGRGFERKPLQLYTTLLNDEKFDGR